jgi:hypothetical protein
MEKCKSLIFHIKGSTHCLPIHVCMQREEKKREAMESEVSLQRIQMKYKVCQVPYGWFFVSFFPFFLLDHLLFNISICLFGCMLCHAISVFCL